MVPGQGPERASCAFVDHESIGSSAPIPDRVIEGSPKNSISSVPIMAWPEP
jgi:hypothetical protein